MYKIILNKPDINKTAVNKTIITMLFVPLCWISALTGCDRGAVVAKVDGDKIRAQELVAEAERAGLPATAQNLELLLGKLIAQRAAEAQAEALNLFDDPDFKRSVRLLALDELRKRYQQQELEHTPLEVSDDEIKASYEQNQDHYFRPAKARIALIAFENNGDESAQFVKKSYQQLLEAKADQRDFIFQKLAAKHSLDRASRYRGGDIGYLQQGQSSKWTDEVVTAAFKLEQVGQLSTVIETEKSIYLLKLIDRQASYTEALSAVSEKIRQQLLTQKVDAMRQGVQEKLMAGLTIHRNEDVLASLSIPAEEKHFKLPSPALN